MITCKILIRNSNRLSSVLVANSVHLTETYNSLEQLLEKINYKQQQWTSCGELKVLCLYVAFNCWKYLTCRGRLLANRIHKMHSSVKSFHSGSKLADLETRDKDF